MTREWLVNKTNLSVAYLNRPMTNEELQKAVSSGVFESPSGRKAIYTYGEMEPNEWVELRNFMILENPAKPKTILQTDYSNVCMWKIGRQIVNWSPDERFVGITVIPLMGKQRSYYEGKLIVDMKTKRYSFIPLSGAFSFRAVFLNRNRIQMEYAGKHSEREYFLLVTDRAISMSKLVWGPLSELKKLSAQFGKGVYGNVLGLKREKYNIRFRNGYCAWPYSEAPRKPRSPKHSGAARKTLGRSRKSA